ncbi:unnamed protein product [Polarella glacialis]|uniref:Protein kinase domain-containing protein n=1 Tax=Polarella glacialis TaxID=89957 RepID=A0A813GL52_POLGL|nr:unnamed protein product [Polarella glacialis]
MTGAVAELFITEDNSFVGVAIGRALEINPDSSSHTPFLRLCPTHTGQLQVFDDYEFLAAIGSGAFGRVPPAPRAWPVKSGGLRDIKPDNVLFVDATASSPLKLIDFGLAGFAEQLREAAVEVSVPRSGSLGRLAKILPRAGARRPGFRLTSAALRPFSRWADSILAMKDLFKRSDSCLQVVHCQEADDAACGDCVRASSFPGTCHVESAAEAAPYKE